MITQSFWTLVQDGAQVAPSGVMARVGALLLVYLIFSLMQRALSRRPLFKSISLQLNLLTLMLLALLFLKPILLQMHPHVGNAVMAAAAFLGVALSLKLIDVVFFGVFARWRSRPQVPQVVRDLGRWAVAAIALVLIVRGFFPGVNLNVLAVSSLVVGYVVGNATQDTLGNLISGLALNTERPFQIGDWVTVGGHTGMVVDTTWRATRLRTKADDYIVIPNGSIAREAIINYSRPTGNHACALTIGVSYDTPPNKARRVILGALAEISDVCTEPPPMVYLAAYADSAITFTIKFFIRDFARLDPIQSAVMDRLWYAFRRERISIPFPIQDCRERDAVADEIRGRGEAVESVRVLLAGVDLFQSLSVDEMGRLVEGARLQIFAAGEKLCRQSEPGDSFYIIRNGKVSVLVAGADGKQVSVAQLGERAFFGEMSLLTGEPRSATVVAETDVEVVQVAKQAFAGLLQANVELAGRLAVLLEKRLSERAALLAVQPAGGSSVETHSALTARIRRFFGLG